MKNIEKIINALDTKEIDAMLICGDVNRRYATGFPSSAGVAVVARDASYFFTDSRYIEAAQKSIKGMQVELVDITTKYSDRINEVIERHGIRTLGIEDEVLSHSEFLKYEEKLKAELVPAQNLLSAIRIVKDEDEIDKLIKAQRLAEKVFESVLELIKPGVTEKEIASELIYRMLRLGADNVSFDPIVVAGEKSSLPHGVPGNEKIREGSFVTIDFGCKLDGYCSDMTRTVAVGKISDEMKKIYDTVLQAQLRGIEAAKAGVTGAEVDAAARAVIENAGYGEYFGHGFGHGLGLEIHEAPTASPSGKTELPEGSVISAEPGIYIPGKFGVRIEDVIVIRKNGCENITKAAKELICL